MSAFRYFGRDTNSSGVNQIYRCPADGIPINEQSLEAVERLEPDGTWLPGFQPILMDDILQGHFDEEENEITKEQARAYWEKWVAAGWPKR